MAQQKAKSKSEVTHCRRTLRSEGHSAAGWGIGGSVELLLRVQSLLVRAMDSRWLRRAAYR